MEYQIYDITAVEGERFLYGPTFYKLLLNSLITMKNTDIKIRYRFTLFIKFIKYLKSKCNDDFKILQSKFYLHDDSKQLSLIDSIDYILKLRPRLQYKFINASFQKGGKTDILNQTWTNNNNIWKKYNKRENIPNERYEKNKKSYLNEFWNDTVDKSILNQFNENYKIKTIDLIYSLYDNIKSYSFYENLPAFYISDNNIVNSNDFIKYQKSNIYFRSIDSEIKMTE